MSDNPTIQFADTQALTSAIRQIARTLCLPQPYEEFLGDAMREFVIATMVKFKKGNDEHGGNFFRCNFAAERRNEVKDLVMYEYGEQFAALYKDKMDLWLKENGQSNERNP